MPPSLTNSSLLRRIDKRELNFEFSLQNFALNPPKVAENEVLLCVKWRCMDCFEAVY